MNWKMNRIEKNELKNEQNWKKNELKNEQNWKKKIK